jgi:Predicted transcriptional regulator
MRVINVKLREVLAARNMTQLQLSERSGVRQAAISAMCRNNREMISLRHLERIADALEIDDINELLTIEVANP